MSIKLYQKLQLGLVGVPMIIFILVITSAAGIGYFKILDIQTKVNNRNAQIENELGQLHLLSTEDKRLKEKTQSYSRLGVEIPEIATAAAAIREFILKKDILGARGFISELNNKLESALVNQKEAEKSVAIGSKIRLEEKTTEYKKKGVNVLEVDAKLPEVRSLIDSGEITAARNKIATLSARLDSLLAGKLEEERKAQEANITNIPLNQNLAGINYSKKTIGTLRGNFAVDVLTVDLSRVQVVTDTANSNDCDNNCPTKPLAQFVADRAGVAGINGTYFCPPDYASCAGKVASYDFPVYNTILGKFINAKTLFWSGRAMVAIDTAGKAHFFRNANSFGGINIRAAIVNYPPLIDNGQIVVDESVLSPTKGNRGALGFDGNTLFAVIGHGASVGDMAYVMQALGAKFAINIDGGGSSAMFFAGSYKVGPGRNLPNAVVFVP